MIYAKVLTEKTISLQNYSLHKYYFPITIFNKIQSTDVYSGPCATAKMEHFAIIVNCF